MGYRNLEAARSRFHRHRRRFLAKRGLDADVAPWDSERMEMAEIGQYVGKWVHVHGGGTDVEGHLEHVQTVTYTAGDCDDVAREILDGYVVVIDGKKVEFAPGAQFEVLDGS